jgi:cation:H+ antiporter
MEFLLMTAGLGLLIGGGELLVRGSVALATRLRVSPMVIGLTVVGFGTSVPELVTSVDAALAGSPGIAIGNVIGSNTANILLIVGAAAILYPLAPSLDTIRRDCAMLAGATVIGVAVIMFGSLTRATAAFLLAGLVIYVYLSFRTSAKSADTSSEAFKETSTLPNTGLSLALVAVGLCFTIFGAQWLVDGAIATARGLGISETFLGLTIVAVGTSLPELAASTVAALRRQSDIAFGNIVGSNIFNILGILGAAAMARPLTVPSSIASMDILVCAGATALLIGIALLRRRFGRMTGLVFLVGYVGYLLFLGSAEIS